MIATVHPYKPQNDAVNSGFKIEDVTDDPKYKDYDPDNFGGLEGSLVEYCRIDSRHQNKAPHVFGPSSVVSARSINLDQKVSLSGMPIKFYIYAIVKLQLKKGKI
jgi:hypothetical protein